MTLVKVCGMTHEDDVALCVRAGVDRLGFVVEYPVANPWNLSRDRAAALMAAAPRGIARVAVVGGDAATILAIAEATRPDMLQIHDDGGEEVVAGVAGHGMRVVKALRVGLDEADLGPEEWILRAQRFLAAGADEVLVDSKTASRPAGTGHAVDRELVREIVRALRAPVVLAGGLTPENVAATIRAVRPAAVDVISGVEDDRHRKDAGRVPAFVAAVRAVDGELGPEHTDDR